MTKWIFKRTQFTKWQFRVETFTAYIVYCTVNQQHSAQIGTEPGRFFSDWFSEPGAFCSDWYSILGTFFSDWYSEPGRFSSDRYSAPGSFYSDCYNKPGTFCSDWNRKPVTFCLFHSAWKNGGWGRSTEKWGMGFSPISFFSPLSFSVTSKWGVLGSILFNV